MAKLLRLQAVYTRTRGAVVGDDVAITTHDFRIEDDSWPDAATTHTYEGLETDFTAFWTTLRTQDVLPAVPYATVGAAIGLSELRWYREDDGEMPWGDASRVTPLTRQPGVGNTCPPQVSCTVTELTDQRKHWGRFYIPGISAAALAADGSLRTEAVTKVATAAQTLYNAWTTRGVMPIVLGPQPLDMDPRDGYPVLRVRVDDVLDVQRRRRWNAALNRQERIVNA